MQTAANRRFTLDRSCRICSTVFAVMPGGSLNQDRHIRAFISSMSCNTRAERDPVTELDRKELAELFDYLFANPPRSVIHDDRERYLIVIDALDEAGKAGCNPLVEMLARNARSLPEWWVMQE